MLNLLKNGEIIGTYSNGSVINVPGFFTSSATIGAREEINDDVYELVEASPAPEPEPLTPEELRAQFPPLTPRQFRDALIDHDIMPDDVTAAFNQIADVKDRAKALNAWEYPTQFVRTEPLIEQIGAIFSLTPEDIDDMWRQATA